MDAAVCYAALAARRREFDGLFFAAVRTTGIFCAPGCPAGPPLARNVAFHASAAECLAAGYRPCLRCRPLDRPAAALAARWIGTPLGAMVAVASGAGLHLLEFADRRALPAELAALRRRAGAIAAGGSPHLDAAEAWLAAHFAGTAAPRPALATAGTPFQRRVWDALAGIPRGATRSYGDLARALGASGPRAVARANGANAVALIVPCHRVVGADGSPTGYGGGLWRKAWLLDHERRHWGTA